MTNTAGNSPSATWLARLTPSSDPPRSHAARRAAHTALQQLLTPPPKSVLYVGHFEPEEGRPIFEHAKGLKLEGLVAKRLRSVYKPGVRTGDWTKVKRKGAVPPERFKRSNAV